jgi:hypothetical protein
MPSSDPKLHRRSRVRSLLRGNGLSLALSLMFMVALVGQSLVGQRNYNNDQRDHAQPTVSYPGYIANQRVIHYKIPRRSGLGIVPSLGKEEHELNFTFTIRTREEGAGSPNRRRRAERWV